MPRGAVVPRVWKRPQAPSECWSWVDPEDVLRNALAAFYAVVKDFHRSFDPSEAVDWREQFADDLVLEFAERLQQQRHQLGLPDPGGHNRAAAVRVQLRELHRSRGVGVVDPDAELRPVMPQQHQSAPPPLVNSAA
ncbi:MAG: hypothetical protein DI537_60740 [Stutzerimonas stutzeri]|nr:MAG: hypothetical protein DI537_60740 [Stutzerimonas stutzeri]